MAETRKVRKPDGGAAYPTLDTTEQSDALTLTADGLSKRDWFAGLALQGLLASPGTGQYAPAAAARLAYEYADAMVTERNGPDAYREVDAAEES